MCSENKIVLKQAVSREQKINEKPGVVSEKI